MNKKKQDAAQEYTHVVHPIPPLYDRNSEILILGSLPSVKSREAQFFYHHPQNRFWRVLALITEDETPGSIEEKKAFLHRHHFAVWDVIRECDIIGSSDGSIRGALPNDIGAILKAAPIQRILTNGEKAYRLYERYCLPQTGMEAVRCPSTSPANASFSLERLAGEWKRAMTQETKAGSV